MHTKIFRQPSAVLAAMLFAICPWLPQTLHAMPVLPENGTALAAFIPVGWAILTRAEGDLNGDGRSDTVLVLKNEAEDKEDGQEESRLLLLLLLLLQSANGYGLSAVSDTVILCKACGGTLGDPFQSAKIEKGILVIRQSGGSREVWDFTFRFRLQTDGKQQSWFLIGWTSGTFDRATGESTTRDFNLLTGDVVTKEERLNEKGEMLPAQTVRTKRKPLSLKLQDFNPDNDLLATP